MALKITHRVVDGVDVLALEGQIVVKEETGALRAKVKNLLGLDKKNIVLNLGKVTLIDSTGLGALVTAYSSATSGGASLRLCNLGLRPNELLQVTKLHTIFAVSNTEEDAVRALAKRSPAD